MQLIIIGVIINIPEGDEDDAVDDIELFQNAGHAGSSELENKRRWHHNNMIRPRLISLTDTCLAPPPPPPPPLKHTTATALRQTIL